MPEPPPTGGRIISGRDLPAALSGYPLPAQLGRRPSIAQLRALHQIATAPLPVCWAGMAMGGDASLEGVPRAPVILFTVVAGVWQRGLIELAPRRPDELFRRIVVSARGTPLLRQRRLAYEFLRWRAVVRLCAELNAQWVRYRVLGGEASERPPLQPRARDIRAVMRQIGAEDRGRRGPISQLASPS